MKLFFVKQHSNRKMTVQHRKEHQTTPRNSTDVKDALGSVSISNDLQLFGHFRTVQPGRIRRRGYTQGKP